MATIKSYTDLEQSKKLAEILPFESADMFWLVAGNTPRVHVLTEPLSNYRHWENYPCWSLAALLGVLPYGYSSILTKSFNGKDYYCKIDGKPFVTEADNPIGVCYEMILKLHKLNLL